MVKAAGRLEARVFAPSKKQQRNTVQTAALLHPRHWSQCPHSVLGIVMYVHVHHTTVAHSNQGGHPAAFLIVISAGKWFEIKVPKVGNVCRSVREKAVK